MGNRFTQSFSLYVNKHYENVTVVLICDYRKHVEVLIWCLFWDKRSMYGTDMTCIEGWDEIDLMYTYKVVKDM